MCDTRRVCAVCILFYTMRMKIEPQHYFIIAIIALFLVGVSLSNKENYQVATVPQSAAEEIPSVTSNPTEKVVLKNGDVYPMSAGYVAHTVQGRQQRMLAYNGSIPGPTIVVTQGDEITIPFTNNTDLPTLLHSHGVRMDNAFDGSQSVQSEMQPGETFEYRLKFPDPGIYWYHPHAKEVYAQGRGMYGAFVVKPKDAGYFPVVDREEVLFISDIPIQNGVIALSKDAVTHSLMGHYGNVMLVNGSDAYTMSASEGDTVRLYLVNSANVRPFNVAIEGVQMKLVGGDSGAYEQSKMVDSVTLHPSERAIVDVRIPRSGMYRIVNKTPINTTTLGTLAVVASNALHDNSFATLPKNEETARDVASMKKYFDMPPTKTVNLSIDMHGMGGMDHSHGAMGGGMGMMGGGTSATVNGVEWEDGHVEMNAMSSMTSLTWKMVDTATGKSNMDVNWVFKKDEPVKIRIFNDPMSMHPMQHPIHFHGQRFLVIDRNGVRQSNLVWKDTVLVASGETVDILLDTSNPGKWMAHCHISEHLEAGMMIGFEVL